MSIRNIVITHVMPSGSAFAVTEVSAEGVFIPRSVMVAAGNPITGQRAQCDCVPNHNAGAELTDRTPRLFGAFLQPNISFNAADVAADVAAHLEHGFASVPEIADALGIDEGIVHLVVTDMVRQRRIVWRNFYALDAADFEAGADDGDQ